MRVVICIPTYNERENLTSLVEEVLATNPTTDVMILDDDSPDGTGQVADLIAKREPRVTVVHRVRKEGIGRAYVDGFQRALAAGYDVIVQMDGDFSHQPRFLPRVLQPLSSADMVIGSRYVAGAKVETWGLPRRVLSFAGNFYARTVFGMKERDLTSGFVAYRRHVLEAVGLETIQSESYAFQLELKYRAHRLGFVIVEVPIVFFDRVVGLSKMQGDRVSEALMGVIKLRFGK